jgi:hypothetical protein
VRCGIGSWGARCLSMEDYVMRTGHEAGGDGGRRRLELPTLLTLENISEMIMINAALEQGGKARR